MAALALFLLLLMPCSAATEPQALPSWATVPAGHGQRPPHHLISFTEDERRAALRAGPIDWVADGAVTPPTSQGRCATCAYFAGTAAVWSVLFLPEHQRRDGLVNLDRRVADPGGKCRGVQPVLCRTRAGAAGVERVHSKGAPALVRAVKPSTRGPLAHHHSGRPETA